MLENLYVWIADTWSQHIKYMVQFGLLEQCWACWANQLNLSNRLGNWDFKGGQGNFSDSETGTRHLCTKDMKITYNTHWGSQAKVLGTHRSTQYRNFIQCLGLIWGLLSWFHVLHVPVQTGRLDYSHQIDQLILWSHEILKPTTAADTCLLLL